MRGDLDWIVMKSLEKDRTRRYETVNGLACDIERHLNGEPVVARPPSKAYLAGKFIRKHRVSVAAVTGVALALIAGLALALVGFAQARHERQRAQDEAANATAIGDFLRRDLLGQASPNNNPNRGVKLGEVLDRAADKIKDRFSNQPLVEASIRQTIGTTYGDLGEYDAAEPHLLRAVAILSANPASNIRTLVRAQENLAVLRSRQGRHAEAEKLLRRVVEQAQAKLGPEDGLVLHGMSQLALETRELGRTADAVRLFRETLERQRRRLGPDNDGTLTTMENLAGTYGNAGLLAEAAAMVEEVLTISRRAFGPQHPSTLLAMSNLALSRSYMGDCETAATLLQEVVESERQVLGPQHALLLKSQQDLVSVEGAMGHWQACLPLCRSLVESSLDLQRKGDAAFCGAVAGLLIGETNTYREFAERLRAMSAGSTNTNLPRMVAEICFLKPEALTNLDPAKIELAIKTDSDAIYKLARGMAEYRCGNLEAALNGLGDLSQENGALASQAGYFCAMIHYRRGDAVAATQAMVQASNTLARFVSSGNLGREWHGYGRATAIRSEAERLIYGREVSTLVDAAWLASARKQWAPARQHLAAADQLAAQRKWPEARAEYLAAMREPAFHWENIRLWDWADRWLPMRVGIALLLANDRRGYEQSSPQWAALLKEHHSDPEIACELILACLLREMPPSDPLLEQAAQWTSDFGHLGGVYADAGPLAKTIIAYRSGRFQEAVDVSRTAADFKHVTMREANRILRAMALAQLGQRQEGKTELQRAEAKLAEPLFEVEWWNYGLSQLALDEAHRLFGEAQRK